MPSYITNKHCIKIIYLTFSFVFKSSQFHFNRFSVQNLYLQHCNSNYIQLLATDILPGFQVSLQDLADTYQPPLQSCVE